MKVFLGSDHGGFQLKEQVKEWFGGQGFDFEDLGNTVLDQEDDYPDFAFKVAEKVAGESDSFGILFCRSAAGMVIAANKIKGIRAVTGFDIQSAKHAREHNNANILALSGDWMDLEKAKAIVKVFLETKFTGEERHARRIKKITDYEKTNNKNV